MYSADLNSSGSGIPSLDPDRDCDLCPDNDLDLGDVLDRIGLPGEGDSKSLMVCIVPV